MEEAREDDEQEEGEGPAVEWRRSGMQGGRGEGKREGELKGPRYASVGVGPDWTRVSTFLRRSEREMQGKTRGNEIHREKADRARSERNREGEDKRDIGEKGRV